MSLESLFSVPARDAASRFLRDHADGAPLYPGGSLASAAAVTRRAARLDGWDGDRAALAAWLAEQNGFAPCHPAQEKNLADAARPDALFVTTGQQPGLLGGPALGLCKALTAVAWAREWSVRLGRPVIPVFWAAGDDSDLAESNAAEFLEPGASPSSVSLEFPDAEAAVPMSRRVLTEAAVHALGEALPAAWSAESKARAAACYTPGRSLTEAFLLLMHGELAATGLLFVDGLSVTRRPEAQAVLRRVVEDSAGFREALLRGTTRLRETLGLPPQVPVRPGAVPVFRFRDGLRVRLFAADSGRVYAAGEEDADLRPALADPGSDITLLHSALTRPLVVETLFPTLGHVLGPAELRYFAQLADVFPAYGRSLPPLAPRRQALVIPRAGRDGLEALEAAGLSREELLDPRPSRVREHLTAAAWARHPAAAEFPDEDYRRFREALQSYQARRFPGAGFDAALRRLDASVGRSRDQARRLVFAETEAARFRALQPLLRWLAGGLQDRHLNLLSLRNVLGEDGLEALIERLTVPGDDAGVYVVDHPEGGPR